MDISGLKRVIIPPASVGAVGAEEQESQRPPEDDSAVAGGCQRE
jgi:hypothetical protein